MSEERFETKECVFLIQQVENQVRVRVGSTQGLDLNADDQRNVESYMDDLGKWEELVRAGVSFFGDNMVNSTGVDISSPYNLIPREEYNFTYTRDRGVITVFIRLSSEERLIRTGAVGANLRLPLEEVAPQIKNVLKWRSFIRAVKYIKGALSAT